MNTAALSMLRLGRHRCLTGRGPIPLKYLSVLGLGGLPARRLKQSWPVLPHRGRDLMQLSRQPAGRERTRLLTRLLE